jgi:hypothetical protein
VGESTMKAREPRTTHGALMAAAGGAFGVLAAVLTALITTWVAPELAGVARWAAAGVVPFGLVAGLVYWPKA